MDSMNQPSPTLPNVPIVAYAWKYAPLRTKNLPTTTTAPSRAMPPEAKNMPCNVNVHRAAQVTNWDAR